MARRKITESEGIDLEDLPKLTQQQMEFVKGILDGKTASDAYRAAYDCENSTNRTIWVNASKLRANANVALWLAAARKAHLGTAVLTKEAHMQELERLREIALDSGNVGAAVQAEQIRGKVAGWQVDQVKDITERTDVIATLKEIEKHSPELAASLAAQNGIEWCKPEGETAH